MGIRLNLGASDTMHPGSINVDIFRPHNADESFVQADLTQRWPWEDSSVDHIRAHDIIEHLPHKIHTMNEAHRVLKPGGTLEIVVPTTKGYGADQDPEHCSYWNPNSFFYHVRVFFEWKRFHLSGGGGRGYRPFDIPGCPTIESARQYLNDNHQEYGDGVWKLRITLEAVK